MSMLGKQSPKVSMTSDVGSTLDLTEHEEQEEQCRLREVVTTNGHHHAADEKTPLVNDQRNGPTTEATLNTTLLVTIVVVTIGSSFQFGYGTGERTRSFGWLRCKSLLS